MIKETLKWLGMVAVGWYANRVLPIPLLAEQYLRGLIQLARYGIVLPMVVAVVGASFNIGWLMHAIGSATNWNWLVDVTAGGAFNTMWMTAGSGLWCSFWSLVLGIWAAPIGLMVDSVLPRKATVGTHPTPEKGWLELSAERYVSIVRGIFMWETVAFVALCIIPVRNNWGLTLLSLMCVVSIVAMIHHWNRTSEWYKETLFWGNVGAFLFCLVRICFPGMTFRSQWGLSANYEWTETSLLIALVGGGLLFWGFLKLALKSKAGSSGDSGSANHTPATAGHGGHGGHGGGQESGWVGKLALLLIGGAVLGVAAAVAVGAINKGQVQVSPTHYSPQLNTGPWLPVIANTDSWTSVDIKKDVYATYEVDGDATILVKVNDGPHWEYRRGMKTVRASPSGDYRLSFRGKTEQAQVRVTTTHK